MDTTLLKSAKLELRVDDLQLPIHRAVSFAGKRHVVFQLSAGGEDLLTSGGMTDTLKGLITSNINNAFFAFAAGNGGVDINNEDPPDPKNGGGVARLSASFVNIMAVGALKHDSDTSSAPPLENADTVFKASNYLLKPRPLAV